MAIISGTKNLSAEDDIFASIVEAKKAAEPGPAFAGGILPRPSISEQVLGRNLAMIRSGNMKPGDKLPTEQQTCLAFGISRPPLRAALKTLTVIGILESRQGARYPVTNLSLGRLLTPFNVLLPVADQDLHVQFEARAVIELELVRFCTERSDYEQRACILRLAKDGRAFYRDPVEFRLLDNSYHQALNRGANNTIPSTISEGLFNVANDTRRLANATPGVIGISVDQHCPVAEAIAAAQVHEAIRAYREHLEHIRDTTISAIHKLSEQDNDRTYRLSYDTLSGTGRRIRKTS